MKCPETNRLKEYAYGLMTETTASELRAHLDDCSHCRDVVQQHHRLSSVLDEWKVDAPTPAFDARVRSAVEERQAQSHGWGFGGWDWMRGLALASLGVLMVAGVVWFAQNHRNGTHSRAVGTIAARPQGSETMPPKVAVPQLPVQSAQAKVTSKRPGMKLESAPLLSNDDRVARAMDDYDLAANFDVLSEIPKGEERVTD